MKSQVRLRSFYTDTLQVRLVLYPLEEDSVLVYAYCLLLEEHKVSPADLESTNEEHVPGGILLTRNMRLSSLRNVNLWNLLTLWCMV